MTDAIEREARNIDTAEVVWRGHTFTVPSSPDDWDVELTLAFEEGKVASAISMLLGAEQWNAFMSTKPKPKNRDLGEMFEAVAQQLGFQSAGE